MAEFPTLWVCLSSHALCPGELRGRDVFDQVLLRMPPYTVGAEVEVRRDDGSLFQSTVKYAPWELGFPGSGTWVVGVNGISGGYALDRVQLTGDGDG